MRAISQRCHRVSTDFCLLKRLFHLALIKQNQCLEKPSIPLNLIRLISSSLSFLANKEFFFARKKTNPQSGNVSCGGKISRGEGNIKNPALAVCNSSYELGLETGGTQSVAYDFQSRPVGHPRSQGSVFSSLRSRELVSNHEQGRVNSKLRFKELAALPLSTTESSAQ